MFCLDVQKNNHGHNKSGWRPFFFSKMKSVQIKDIYKFSQALKKHNL